MDVILIADWRVFDGLDVGGTKKLPPGLCLRDKPAMYCDEVNWSWGVDLWGSIDVPVALGSVIYQVLLKIRF